MAHLTLEVSDELAKRIRPLEPWLPAILELSLLELETQATATATEIIQFLSKDPTPQEVLSLHVSEQSQNRLRRLLALNQAGLLDESEQRELDERQRIEHTLIMLKARLAPQVS